MAQDKVILVKEEPNGPSELIEIPVLKAGLQKIPIPTIDQLRSDDTQRIIIKGMRLIIPEVAVGAPLLAGPNATLSELQKMFLVIYAEGWEKGHYIPLLTLNDMHAEGSNTPFRYAATRFNNWEKVEWNKSFIQLANGTVTAGGEFPYNILLDVQYVKLATQGPNIGQEIIGPS